jgi:hypothetical protein
VCFIISADEALDGQEMLLGAALDRVVGSFFGTFLSCLPGKLGYFNGENIRSSYILYK